MKEILQNLKFIDYLTTEIEIEKGLFVGKFKSQVDEGDIGLFSDTFDIFFFK